MNQHTNIVEYLTLLIKNTMKSIKCLDTDVVLTNEVRIEMGHMNFEDIMYFIECPENRRTIIQKGVESAEFFITEI